MYHEKSTIRYRFSIEEYFNPKRVERGVTNLVMQYFNF